MMYVDRWRSGLGLGQVERATEFTCDSSGQCYDNEGYLVEPWTGQYIYETLAPGETGITVPGGGLIVQPPPPARPRAGASGTEFIARNQNVLLIGFGAVLLIGLVGRRRRR